MHPDHASLLENLKELRRNDIEQEMFKRYHGTPRYCYGVRVPNKTKIAKKYLKEMQPSVTELEAVLTSLYQGESYDERSLAGYVLLFSKHTSTISLEKFEGWLDHLVGWAEVDSTCQSSFSAQDILVRWEAWQKLLLQLNRSVNVNQRRASLVLLVKATRESSDPKLADLAFQLIENVEHERDILITKAISWLLRSMTTNYPDAVAEYVMEHHDTLPKIALREVRAKLDTGRKNHGKKR